MERNRFTLYTNWANLGRAEEPVFTLEQAEGLTPMTAFLPSGYRISIDEQGKQMIKDKYGQPIQRFGAQRTIGRPQITPAPRDGKAQMNAFCDLIDPNICMKVLAYRKKDKGATRWSLDALEGSEAVAVYLPPYCKLIEMERTGRRYIQIPDTKPWEEVIDENGRKYQAPPSPTLLSDFTGCSKDDIPYIEIGGGGQRRKKCYRAEPGDCYQAVVPDAPVVTRMSDGRWQTDTLITDPLTGTAYWSRKHTKTPPKLK